MTTITKYEADWCGPCKTIREPLRKIAAEYSVPVITVDIDKDPGKAKADGIYSLPTILVHKDGKEVLRMSGVSADWMTRLREALE
jgi:thioredoxin 1